MAEQSLDVLAPGDAAPDFALPGADGEPHELADYTDQEALLVVFTCNHCPYAKAKHPPLNALAADYDDVAVVGINPNDEGQYPEDSFDAMVDAVEDGTVAYDAYLRDESQAVAAAYGAVCTPDPFLFAVDADGATELVYHGRIDDAPNPDDEPTRAELREAIDALRAGEPVPEPAGPSRGCSVKWREGNEPDYWDRL